MESIKLLKQMKKYFGTEQVMIQTQIDKALKELEEIESYQQDMDKYLDYTTAGRCSKSFGADLQSLKSIHNQYLEEIIWLTQRGDKIKIGEPWAQTEEEENEN